MPGSLADKVALVTGASSGIGRGIALELAKAGAHVALAARRADRLDELVREIMAAGGRAIALPADVTIEAEASRSIEDTVARLGRIDILINSAGVMQGGGIVDCDTQEYRAVFDVNLFASLYTSAAAVKRMLAQGSGDIITISSLAARKGGAMTSAYSASKQAVNAMTDGMRQELGGKNIRVATLMPGATTSEVGDNISNPRFREMIQAHVSKDGAVQPEEIGQTIVFMLSLPRHVNISEISVRPTIDTSA